jgi:hypothetical protein
MCRVPAHTVLILGGYGFFGTRIAESLVRHPSINLLIAGRELSRAENLARALTLAEENAIRLDARSGDLAATLRTLNVDTVIHTAGPFQDQDYQVAVNAIEAGANYVDLADGRQFVAGIDALDDAARAKGVLIVSGASSVPALSSAVVDRYAPGFQRIESIRIGIGSGARTPGPATVRGVFSYAGKPFRRLEDGVWAETHGWLDLRRYVFPEPVGRRWLGSCDVPDLELFPNRYAPVETVTFHAGFASGTGHLFIWMLAGLVKAGVISGMAPLAGPLSRLARLIEPMVSDKGAMFVELEGVGLDGTQRKRRWCITAARNHGPYIPCGAAIALARKLADGAERHRGAQPCMGLLSVEEYLSPLRDLDIHVMADPP